MSFVFGRSSGQRILKTLKYKTLPLAGVFEVHERIALGAGVCWWSSLEGTTNPREYRPPAAGKTKAGCERTWERINTFQGACLQGRTCLRV